MILHLKKPFLFFLLVVSSFVGSAQIGQTFWFAAPEVTDVHDTPNLEQQIRVATFETAATIRIYQPANAAGLDTTITLAPNSLASIETTPFQELIETKPFDQVVNTGILIESSANITAYYEVATRNNPDVFALKAGNALGNEFYLPLLNVYSNRVFSTTKAYAQFNIVATEDNTTIFIFPSTDILNHNEREPYSIVLNKGQSYSGRSIDETASEKPVGTVISSDKPIAVTYADDSVEPTTCADLYGDQLVPTNIIGQEYIVNSNASNLFNDVDEHVVIVATENFTTVRKNGVEETVLFAGQTYVDITNATTFYSSDKPIYLIQITGFGCELGSAILPPLNCAGSDQVSFARSPRTDMRFFLSILTRTGNEANFELNGNTSLIDSADFSIVPGTNGEWVASFIEYDLTEIPAGGVNLVTNSTGLFSLGIVNGNTNGGTRYGYFSLFQATVITDAGSNITECAGNTVSLNGNVSGGAVTGKWSTTNGSGTFEDDENLNTIYTPTEGDYTRGNVEFLLESTGGFCSIEYDTVEVNFTPRPTIDVGNDQNICANNAQITLNSTSTVATGVIWSGGLANGFSPNVTSNSVTYTPTTSEIAAGSLTLYATTNGVGTCIPFTDSLEITFLDAPVVEAGDSLTSCGNNESVRLSGSVTNFTGFGEGVWSGGSATVNPSNNALTGIYTPTATEISNKTVNLTLTSINNGICNAEQDNVILTIQDAPIVSAGVNQILCANNAEVQLSGSVSNAAGVEWVGGLGTFFPDRNTLNAVYTPTADEISLGSISLLLRTTGNGTCSPEESTMTVTFTPAPSVDAGVAQNICENNTETMLTGTFSVATGVEWSGLNGTFLSGSVSDANATYVPSLAEVNAGSLTAFLTTTGNGSCRAETDSLIITFTDAPEVGAGENINLCANNLSAQLQGEFTISGGVEWVGGTGSFIPSVFDKNAEYIPSALDISNGFVNLTLESRANGNCEVERDNVLISITPEPVLNAGNDFSVCENNPDIDLSASLTVSTGVIWTGGNGTYAPDENSLNTTYTPTDLEISTGSIELTATSSGNDNCIAVQDDILITFTPAPVVEAGDDQIVCGNNASTDLNGQVFGATGGTWSNFSGTFTPDLNALTASYLPSAIEIANGEVILFLTSTGNGNCNTVQDSVTIKITDSPTVEAGEPLTACANNSSLQLDGSFTNAGGVSWSGGNGSFIPSVNDRNATYSPSTDEIANGTLILTLTSTDIGDCFAVNDNVVVSISDAPTANAGPDQVLCANNSEILLNGSSTLSSGAEWSGGFGTFSPNASVANATYTPTASEIASGVLTLRYNTTGNGTCNASFDEVEFNFTPSPEVEAGLPQTSCANNANITLDASVTVATGGIWSGGLGTFSTNDRDLNAVYSPSASEINSGQVVLSFQSTGNGSCRAVSDSVILNITPAPFVSAGDDIFLCFNDDEADLQGIISGGASQGEWSILNGSGFFIPTNQDITGTYRLGSTDILAREANLVLTSTNNGNCLAESDEVSIFLTAPGNADAGSNGETLCANNSDLQLAGSVTGGALNGTWSSSGTGIFSPSSTDLNAIYAPSEQDILSGLVTIELTANSCDQNSSQFDLQITPAPVVDAGEDIITCVNDLIIALDGTVSGANVTGRWVSTGNGTFSPDVNSLAPIYNASSTDSLAGSFSLILESTNVGNCNIVRDTLDVELLEAGIVNAGNNVTLCANNSEVQLNGSVSAGATNGTWSSSGTGSFSPNNTNLQASYFPSEGDILAGLITLTLQGNSCDAALSNLEVTLTPSPTLSVGTDREVCANNSIVNLTSTTTVSTSGIWSSSTGNGTFSSVSDENATYTPDPLDGNEVTIIRTTTGNGNCLALTDSFLLSITESPVVNAGIDQFICADENRVNLLGTVTGGANTGQWSTLGTGGFDPGIVLLETDYLISKTDSTNQGVTLILTSTVNGNCLAVSDTIQVNITDAGTVDAGPENLTVCANNKQVELNATASGGATAVNWITSGGGSFSPDAQSLNATYLPDATDSLAGAVTLTINTNSCNKASDVVNLSITPAPFVFAGPDRITCLDDLQVDLNGIVNGASSTGKWSSNGTGTFIPNEQTLNGTYEASPLDSDIGTVELTLEATNIGNCTAVSDVLVLTITSGGTADAGSDQIVCENNSEVVLNGTFTGGATELTWSTTGTGIFTPNRNNPNATYTPSNQDKLDGIVTLRIETNSCDRASDDLRVTITPEPTVDAGNNLSLCENNTDFNISGSIIGAAGGIWSTDNTGGTFEPSNTSLNAIYVPSETDLNSGQVKIFLSSSGNGNCLANTDSTIITYTDAPNVNAGIDLGVCKNENSTSLDGQINTVTTTGTWSTLGNGFFSPRTDILNAEYTFGVLDTTNGFVDLVLASTNNDNCKAVTDTMRISLGTTTFAFAGDSSIVCNENLISPLDGFVSGGATSGTWSTNGSGTFSPSVNDLNAFYTFSTQDSLNGLVQLTLTANASNGCTPGVDTKTVRILPGTQLNAGDDLEVCIGTDVVTYAGSGDNVSSFQWKSLGSGTFLSLTSDLSGDYQFGTNDILQGNVSLVLSGISKEGCLVQDDTVTISLGNPLSLGFSSINQCFGQETQFADTSTISFGEIIAWEWDFGDNRISTSQNPVNTYTEAKSYEVLLTTETNQGCRDSLRKVVTISPLPVAAFRVDSENETILVGDEVQFIDESELATSWQWIFGFELDTTTIQNPIFTYSDENEFEVELAVTSPEGCLDTTSLILNILSSEIVPPVLPNAFTPNGDDLNDFYLIRGGPFSVVDFKIYNEWGNLIFESDDANKGWDGTYNGVAQPSGVYTYTLKATTIDGLNYQESGDLTLIR